MEIKVSDELNGIINYSRDEAMRTGSYGIGPDHLFLGIIRHEDNNAFRAMEGLGIDGSEMKQFIDRRIFTNETIPYSESGNISFSPFAGQQRATDRSFSDKKESTTDGYSPSSRTAAFSAARPRKNHARRMTETMMRTERQETINPAVN